MATIDPLDPAQAVQMYLTERETDLSGSSHDNHRLYLSHFIDWCDREEIDNMGDLTGRDLFEFRQYRADDLAQSSLQTQISTLRIFIRFCESLDAVEPGLHEKILVPPRPMNSRDEKLGLDCAEQILSYLEKYHYASRNHALFLTMWYTLTGGPTQAVSDRCDVSHRVLDQHYDRRTEEQKMEQRREVLDI